jgi:hypothetical protein
MKKTFLKLTLCLFAVLCLGGTARAANLLLNPGFVPSGSSSDYRVYGLVSPPQWSNFGTLNGPLPNDAFRSDGTNPFPMPDYNGSLYFYDLGGWGNPTPVPGDGVWQSFPTIPGHKYKLTFGHNSEANGISQARTTEDLFESGLDQLRVQVGDRDEKYDSPYNTFSPGYGLANGGTSGNKVVGAWQMPWVEHSLVFTAGSGTTTKVMFTVSSVSTITYFGGEENGGSVAPNGANSQIIAMPLIEELPPTLVVNKALAGTGRINSSADQFTVSIRLGGVVQNDTRHSTTEGNGNTVTGGSGTTGEFTADATKTYTIEEAMAAGSTSSLSQYSATVRCTNAFSGGTDVSRITQLGASIRLAASDAVTCTISNEPSAARLTIRKISNGGIGTFIFKGTANGNGFSTDDRYFVTTTAAGTSTSGATVSLTSADTLTEVQEVLPPGWIVSSANCVDNNAAGTGNPTGTFGNLNGTVLQIPAANARRGSDLQCTFTNAFTGYTVSGKLIRDTGVGGGTPHDAIQNGAEVGHSGVPLNLTNCAGTVYSTATSGSDGSFSLSLASVPAGQAVCLVELLPGAFNPVSVNVGTTAGSYTVSTTTLQFTPGANTNYAGVVLGDAPDSTFVVDGAQQTVAGQSVAYAHVYVAGSAGSVRFASSDSPTPTGLLWSSVLYLDSNCNNVLDGVDSLITGPIQVTAGQQVCILDKVNSPLGASLGAKDFTTVTASETWDVPTLTPNRQVHVLSNTDTTTVSVAGLTLLKEVRKLSSCPVDAAASIANSTPYASSGSALPGDFLEYRLTYGNNTAAPLTGIVIHDAVPVYTLYERGMCLTRPGIGLSACSVTQQPAAGAASGAITWTLTDTAAAPIGLQPLASGTVSYCLRVQN